MWKAEWISKYPELDEYGMIDHDLIEYKHKLCKTKKEAWKIAKQKYKLNWYAYIVEVEPDYYYDEEYDKTVLLGYDEVGEHFEVFEE